MNNGRCHTSTTTAAAHYTRCSVPSGYNVCAAVLLGGTLYWIGFSHSKFRRKLLLFDHSNWIEREKQWRVRIERDANDLRHGLQPLIKSMQKVIGISLRIDCVAFSRRPSSLDAQFNQMQIRINFQCEQCKLCTASERGAADDFLRIARVQLFYQRNDGSAIMH